MACESLGEWRTIIPIDFALLQNGEADAVKSLRLRSDETLSRSVVPHYKYLRYEIRREPVLMVDGSTLFEDWEAQNLAFVHFYYGP